MSNLLKAETSDRSPSGVLRSAVTLFSVFAAVIVARVLQHYWKSEAFASLFFCAIIFSAWFGGYRQGLLAITFSVLAFDYCFLAPINSIAVNLNEVPRLTVFVLCALLMGFLAASQRNNTASLRRTHDDLAAKVKDLKKINESLDSENAQRKLAEGALQRSKAYLAEAQRLSHTGSFDWQVSTGEHFWSEETFRIFQFDPKTKPAVELVLQRVHPDDATLVKETIERASKDGKDFDYEHRLLMPDGSVKHVRIVARAERDESGELAFVGAVMDITVAKEAEHSLRRIETYLSEGQRLSHTGSWAWKVKTKENLFWSKEHYRIYGFDPETTSGPYGAARERIHPDDARAFDETLERAVQERSDFELDHRIVLPGGEVKHIHVVGHPVLNVSGELVEYIGTTMDVTERNLSEALLSSEKHILEMIARGAPLPAVLNDLCSAIDEQSPGLISTVLSVDADGQKLWPVAGPGVPHGWTRMVSPLAIGPCAGSCGTAAYRKETVMVSDIATDPLWADFREVALSYGLKACWSKPIMSTTGSVLGTFATYYGKIRSPGKRDLLLIERATHIAQIAIERDRTQDSLRKAHANLAHATRVTMMGELTASIAHEVNQPLAAVVNNANACISLLPNGAPDLDEVREALAEIIDDADRASSVIARVRQLAKRAPIEKSPLDLGDVVKDVLALARYESAARRITIRTDLPADLPSVSGDRVQLQQVLLNLVINGMDAMNTVEESKRVLMICGCRGTRDGMPETCLSVQDSGAGIKHEEMDRLFEAFYTTKPQGMGMGLAISRSIIEAHCGRLWAEPNHGPGATFLFSLPSAGSAVS
jgi:signal transduction histidine kinase/PAS domain-containing protein